MSQLCMGRSKAAVTISVSSNSSGQSSKPLFEVRIIELCSCRPEIWWKNSLASSAAWSSRASASWVFPTPGPRKLGYSEPMFHGEPRVVPAARRCNGAWCVLRRGLIFFVESVIDLGAGWIRMLFQPEKDFLFLAGSGPVFHVPAVVPKRDGIFAGVMF